MKKNCILIIMAAIAMVAVSCSEKEEKGDGYSFTSKKAIVMQTSISKNDTYVVKEIELDQAQLATAFGGSVPSDLQFYAINSDGTRHVGEEEYTSEYGFYFTAAGDACMPSAEGCSYFIEYYGAAEGYSNPTIGIGQYPGSCEIGDTACIKIGLTDGTVTGQPYTLRITIKKATDWATYFENSNPLTYTVYQTVNTAYTPLKVTVNESALCTALGVASSAAIVTGVTGGTMSIVALNTDDTPITGYTANGYGFWFNFDGNVCNWGAANNCSVYSEWDGTSPVAFTIGQYPSGIEAGDKFTIREEFINGSNTAIITFKIRIVEEVTDNLGPDETK